MIAYRMIALISGNISRDNLIHHHVHTYACMNHQICMAMNIHGFGVSDFTDSSSPASLSLKLDAVNSIWFVIKVCL